jgi:hypothetical protein
LKTLPDKIIGVMGKSSPSRGKPDQDSNLEEEIFLQNEKP